MGGGVLLVFLDGVGIGERDEERNPFARAWARALVPTLQWLVGGTPPNLHTPHTTTPHARTFPVDATLGVPGKPQSGTGQAALLTGVNAAERYGRHFGPWTPVSLRPLVREQSLLRQAVAAGRSVVFANAYPKGWPGTGRQAGRRVAAPPLAAQGAGLLDRHQEALGRGEAVSSELVNGAWQRHLGHDWLPDITHEEAGENLGRIAGSADLTLFAHYATDAAGHLADVDAAVEALVAVDRFLAGVVRSLPHGHTLLVTSDHGNLEDASTTGHTENPSLAIARGPAAGSWAKDIRSLVDVAPRILEHLGVDPGAA